jgi:Phage integrase family
LILFLADTGARLGEATALRWTDLDLEKGTARIARSFSGGRYLSPTKTGRGRTVELSARLREALSAERPDLFGAEALVFPNEAGGLMDPHNFRDRVFRRLVERVLGQGRRFTPHGLRHTFASLHLASATNLKWVQAQGGWASAKMLLDTYGHFIPADTTGYADALAGAPGRPQAAPDAAGDRVAEAMAHSRAGGKRESTCGYAPNVMAPRAGIEPATRCLEGSRSIPLSYRGPAAEGSDPVSAAGRSEP